MTKSVSRILATLRPLMILGSLWLTVGCQTLDIDTDLNGTWVLETIEAEKPTIQFEKPGQMVNGYDGCNRYFGTYLLKETNGISIALSGSTKMYCHNSSSSDEFLLFLGNASRAEINEDKLRLFDATSATSRTFKKL